MMRGIISEQRWSRWLASAVAVLVSLAMVVAVGLTTRGAAFAAGSFVLGGQGSNSSIDGISFQKCSQGYDKCHGPNGDWNQVTGPIEDTDTLRFDLTYTLKQGVLSQQNNVATYQLPSAIKPHEEEQGTIRDNRNTVLGNFTINTNGLVTITYTQAAIGDNANSAMRGNLSFDIAAKDVGVDEENKVHLDFGDEQTIDLTKRSDIQLTKKADYDKNDPSGLITYTLKVSSTYGTEGPVTITDAISSKNNVQIDSESFTVSPERQGWSAQVGSDGKSFTITGLPQLDKDGSYTVTYRAHVTLPTDGSQSTVQVDNGAKASSTDQNGQEISDSADTTVKFKPDTPDVPDDISLQKSGNLQSDGSIEWTITVKPGDQELDGLTITDTIIGSALPKTATITPNPSAGEGSARITFDNGSYTFPAGTVEKTYKITYTTPKPASGVDKVSNTVTDDKGHKDTDEVGVQGEDRLTKTAQGHTTNEAEDGTITYILQWQAKINGSGNGMLDITGPWTFTDMLSQPVKDKVTHYFTDEQQEEIRESVKNQAWALGSDAEVTFTKTGDYVTGFVITGTKKIESSKWATLGYHSTAVIENDKKTSFKNTSSIGDYADDASISVTPEKPIGKTTIKKKDARAKNDSDGTTHNADNDLDYVCVPGEKSGEPDDHCIDNYPVIVNVLHWQLEVKATDTDIRQGLQIVEQLPDGVSFLPNGMALGKSRTGLMIGDAALKLNGETSVAADNNVIFKWHVSVNGNKAVITVPKDWPDNEFKIDVLALIDANAAWTPSKDRGSIKEQFAAANTASVNYLDGTQIDTDTQTQTIYRTHTVVDKTGGLAEGLNNNTLQYSIKVNEDGLDLLKDGDDLVLTDTLTYGYHSANGLMSAYYVPGSLQVYNMTSNGGTGDSLTNVKYTYASGCKPGEHEWDEIKCTHTLAIHVPDQKPLIVEYQYKYSIDDKDNGNNRIGISNSVDLDGYSSSPGEQWHENQSGASGLNASGLSLVKIDADDSGKYLEGAQFDLFKYTCENGGGTAVSCWTKVEGENAPKASNSKGEVSLESLTPNTAYKLVETKAPDGYETTTDPKYFMMTGDLSENPMAKPSGVEITSYNPGDQFFFTNKRQTADFGFKKVDEDSGSTLEGAVFRLFKYKGSGNYQTASLADANNPGSDWERVSDIKDVTSDDNGLVAFSKVPVGKYRVAEVSAPSGYVTPNPSDAYASVEVAGPTDVRINLHGQWAKYHQSGSSASDSLSCASWVSADASGPRPRGPIRPDSVRPECTLPNSVMKLPETGGMGTSALYSTGFVTVAVAGFGLSLVLRRRRRQLT